MIRIAISLCLLISVSYGKHLSNNRIGIFYGHRISIEGAPYISSLRLYNTTANETSHICGASIISDQFLLTAAHCIFPTDFLRASVYKVLVGTDQLTTGGTYYDVEKIEAHKNFSFFERNYDIGIVKVSKPIQFGPKVAKIELPTADAPELPEGTLLNATGWGTTEITQEELSKNLLQAELPVVGPKKCGEELKHDIEVSDKVICAGGTGKDTCQGDSGGPLSLNNTLVGITSFGIGCGGSTPGVYTSVSYMLPWIQGKMKEFS